MDWNGDNDFHNDDDFRSDTDDDSDDDEPCHKLVDPWKIFQTAGNQKPRSYDNGWHKVWSK